MQARVAIGVELPTVPEQADLDLTEENDAPVAVLELGGTADKLLFHWRETPHPVAVEGCHELCLRAGSKATNRARFQKPLRDDGRQRADPFDPSFDHVAGLAKFV